MRHNCVTILSLGNNKEILMKIKATDLDRQLRCTIGLAGEYFVMAISELKEREVDLDMIAGACLLSKIEIPNEPSTACIDVDKSMLPLTKEDKQTISKVIVAYLLIASDSFEQNDEKKLVRILIKAKQAFNIMYAKI